MKQVFACCLAALALSLAARGAPVTCTTGPISLTPGGTSPTISCGGLTFSNFQVLNFTGTNSGRLDINFVTFDSGTGEVALDENPNLGSGGHLNLLFQVSGAVNGIDLTVNGSAATVIERACANPIPLTGVLANSCTNAGQTTSASAIASLTVSSGAVGQPIAAGFSSAGTVYMYKDIAASTGGGLTAMDESFHVGAVPEPVTMILVGSALLGLALVRRRKTN